jgi:hypothetical protein
MVRDSELSGPVPQLPAPQLSGVITALPSLGLATLERGMQRFLEQLEQTAEGPQPKATCCDPWLWVVAGLAAATACELARRQWKRGTGIPAEQLPPMRGSLLDNPVGKVVDE